MFYTDIEISKGKVVERYIDKDGGDHARRVNFEPTFYYPHDKGEYKDIFGNRVKEKVFDNISQSRKWRKEMSDVDISVLGMDDYKLQYIANTYEDEIEFNINYIRIAIFDIEVKSSDGFPKPEEAAHPIDSITHYDSIEDKYFVYALYDWDEYLSRERMDITEDVIDKVVFHKLGSELELLQKYKTDWCSRYPHVLTGWNSETFDIPYIINRYDVLLGEGTAKFLSPWKKITSKDTRDKFGNPIRVYKIGGVSCIDYLAAYKKFVLEPRKSYKLDHIAEVELGDNKVEYEGKLHELSETDPQKYVDYNIKDVSIIVGLDNKRKLFQLIFELAYYARCSFEDTLGTIKIWDAIIYNSLRRENIAIPPIKKHDKAHFEGAFVKEPVVGIYDWVMSFDLTSLYPHIMMQWNISLETFVRREDEQSILAFANKSAEIDYPEYAYNPSGSLYRKDIKGVIPREVEKVFIHRKEHKNKEFEANKKAEQCKLDGDMKGYEHWKNIESAEHIAQWSRKILINGLYGATGNKYFRYYRVENAASTTAGAQLAIRWIERKLNEYMNRVVGTTNKNYVIYIDTDSVYIQMKPLLEKMLAKKGKKIGDLEKIKIVDFLDNVGKKKIEPYIKKSYQEMADYTNSYEQKMFMDREAIASRGFWTAKKRYALMVWDNEGKRKFDENGNVIPSKKVIGLETRKAGTPNAVIPALEKSYDILLTSDDNQDLVDHYESFKKEYMKKDVSEMVQVSGVNNIKKYSRNGFPIKGTPHNVKAALFFNRLAEEHGIPPIKDGEKICMLNIKYPNPYNEKKIAWVSGDKLPEEFNLDLSMLVDKKAMFDNTFTSPIENICKVTNWSYEKQSPTLGDTLGI